MAGCGALVDEKKYKKHLLITAFILAGVIFLAGTALGWTIDNLKVNSLTDAIRQNELNTESLLLESQFVDNFGGDYCELLNLRIKDIQSSLGQTGEQLSTWGASKKYKISDFDYLKRKYFLLEIRFLFLLQDMTRTCGNNHEIILFFYRIDDTASTRQGYVLDNLRLTRDDLVVLSFDKDYTDEPLIKMLLIRYDVASAAPAIVINGNKALTGYVSQEQIESYI